MLPNSIQCVKQLRITEQLTTISKKYIAQQHVPVESALAELKSSNKNSKEYFVQEPHAYGEFFIADLIDYAYKSDSATMEAPIFSLSTTPDLTPWRWESKDGRRRVDVIPSVLGRATIHDKAVLIYVISQMTEALNRGRLDAIHRAVRFSTYDYLKATNKKTSGKDYIAFELALRRLSGTRIFTNIETGGKRIKTDFGFIDSFEIVEKSAIEEKMMAVRVVLSEWFFQAIQNYEVLTLHPDYFRLRKPTDRRIYEIARKHFGRQAAWSIGFLVLYEKSGSRATIYEFHKALKALVTCNHLPTYGVRLTAAINIVDIKVHFYRRDKLKSIR